MSKYMYTNIWNMLKVTLLNGTMIDRLLQYLFIAGAVRQNINWIMKMFVNRSNSVKYLEMRWIPNSHPNPMESGTLSEIQNSDGYLKSNCNGFRNVCFGPPRT